MVTLYGMLATTGKTGLGKRVAERLLEVVQHIPAPNGHAISLSVISDSLNSNRND
jgi:hypothetical protein